MISVPFFTHLIFQTHPNNRNIRLCANTPPKRRFFDRRKHYIHVYKVKWIPLSMLLVTNKLISISFHFIFRCVNITNHFLRVVGALWYYGQSDFCVYLLNKNKVIHMIKDKERKTNYPDIIWRWQTRQENVC